VQNSGDYLTMTLGEGDIPYLVAPLGTTGQIRMWYQNDGYWWSSELLPISGLHPFPSRMGVRFDSDDKPHVAFSAFRGTERYDLYWATRAAGVPGVNWDRYPVVADVPRAGHIDRPFGVCLILDALGRPHLFYLSGVRGDFDSALWLAVPRP
jgi:hypothetical protein